MKKRVILGIILIIIAIGGTIAMNTAGIFKGTPYVAVDETEYFSYVSYTFYENTYKEEHIFRTENNKISSSNDFYTKQANEIKFGTYESGKGRISPYKLVINDTKYINKTAIWTQIGLVVVLIFGIIEIAIARISKKKQN